MSTFPDDWKRKAKVNIAAGQKSGSPAYIALPITEDILPSEMFDSDGDHPSQSDGGDIRVSSDEDGDNRIACHVARWSTDANPANGYGTIYVSVDDLNASNEVWVWWETDDTDTQPASPDSYSEYGVLGDDCVGYWTLDEDEGDTAPQFKDWSRSGLDGTKSETITSGATGKIGNAVTFGGSPAGRVDIGSSSDHEFDTVDFTVMGWAKPSSLTNDPMIIGRAGAPSGVAWGIGIRSAGYVFCEFRKNSGAAVGSTSDGTTVSTGSWLHIAAQFDRSHAMYRYLNGAATGQGDNIQSQQGETTTPSYGTAIGARSDADTAQLMNGDIDEVQVWSRLLTADEILTYYRCSNDQDAFWEASTPEDGPGASAGGGGGSLPKVTDRIGGATLGPGRMGLGHSAGGSNRNA